MTHRPLIAVLVLLPLGAWGQTKKEQRVQAGSITCNSDSIYDLCKSYTFEANTDTIVVKRVCDVPALVKAAREHLEIEDREDGSGVLTFSGSNLTIDSCQMLSGSGSILLWSNGEEDLESKIRRLECGLRDAKATLKYRREREEREAKKADALARLRSALAGCEAK